MKFTLCRSYQTDADLKTDRSTLPIKLLLGKCQRSERDFSLHNACLHRK